MINIKINKIDNIIHKFKRINTLVGQGTRDGINWSLRTIRDQANSILYEQQVEKGLSANRPDESIRNNWLLQEAKGTSVIEGALGNSSPHSHIVEFGSGKYAEMNTGTDRIRPVKSNYLSFSKYGSPVVAYSVEGQMPKAYFRNAKEAVQNDIPDIISKYVNMKLMELV